MNFTKVHYLTNMSWTLNVSAARLSDGVMKLKSTHNPCPPLLEDFLENEAFSLRPEEWVEVNQIHVRGGEGGRWHQAEEEQVQGRKGKRQLGMVKKPKETLVWRKESEGKKD